MTQAKYGTSNHAAGFDIFLNSIIVQRIESQRTTISTKARLGLCIPKNNNDQREFKDNCNKKTKMAFLEPGESVFSQMINKDNPIRI